MCVNSTALMLQRFAAAKARPATPHPNAQAEQRRVQAPPPSPEGERPGKRPPSPELAFFGAGTGLRPRKGPRLLSRASGRGDGGGAGHEEAQEGV